MKNTKRKKPVLAHWLSPTLAWLFLLLVLLFLKSKIQFCMSIITRNAQQVNPDPDEGSGGVVRFFRTTPPPLALIAVDILCGLYYNKRKWNIFTCWRLKKENDRAGRQPVENEMSRRKWKRQFIGYKKIDLQQTSIYCKSQYVSVPQRKHLFISSYRRFQNLSMEL